MGPMIRIEELVKEFKAVRAVDGISFDVGEGEVFGFLGPNGAGKTTTISMICTLIRPTSGRIEVNGVDAVRHPGRVRRMLGIIFQDPSLDERLTAAENIEFQARLYGVRSSEIAPRVKELLELVKLDDRAGSRVKTFSGGMRRRLEVARGLVHSPRVLFLDEPTLGLDLQTRQLIWNHITMLHRIKGMTVFMTTHYIEEAVICDRIAIVDHGRIIALDTPANLIASVGDDIITIETVDTETFADAARARFSVDAAVFDGGVRITAPGGAELIPRLLREIPVPITSVNLSKPTLNDVFIHLTGRSVRDAEIGASDRMREVFRHAPRRRR
ncbi:MAG: ATP-binding cassette domain-containing protein [bacterium]